MITLSDQLFVSLCLPEDARLTNVSLNGSVVTIESPAQYLARVDLNSRYLGQEVLVLLPYGNYGISDFVTKINNQTITYSKYCFADGTADVYFLPCECCASGGGDGFDPSLSYIFSGNNTFTGTNIHNGTEYFKNVIFTNDGSLITWNTFVDANGVFNFTNSSTGTYVKITPSGLETNSCITTTGITVPGPVGLLRSNCTVDTSYYLTEEEDPIFDSWWSSPTKWSTVGIYANQILDPENIDCGCNEDTILPCLLELTEQDCLNIKNIDQKFAEFNCNGLLHNALDGLSGGNGVDEFYHLTLAEHTFVADLVQNGSGVLASHTELLDIGTYTHDQIDTHIDDATIHLTAADVVDAEEDPVFTAERDALTENYLVMKGTTTLVDSPAYISGTIFIINGDRLELSNVDLSTIVGENALSGNSGTSNVALGVNAGRYIFDGVSPNEFTSGSIYIGKNSMASESNSTNEIVIGNSAIGNGTNTVTIGDALITDNYFTGIVHANTFDGGIFQVNNGLYTTYITGDASGNLIFYDDVVGTEVTLTELLAGGSGGFSSWNLSANNTISQVVGNDDTVSFNGGADIDVARNLLNINIALKNTSVTPGTYQNPDITVDSKGRVTAIVSNTSGCSQLVADMGTQNGSIDLNLDTYSGAVVTLDGPLVINFTNVMDGDTGHIEVTHDGATSLSFSTANYDIRINTMCYESAGEVKLSPYAAVDIVAYWVALNNIHLAVIYDSKL